MKDLFFMGGPSFMAILTVLLIATSAWIIFHFIMAYNSDQTGKEKFLRRIDYGKTMGLFSMIVGITGQMVGLYNMFLAIEDAVAKALEVDPALVFGGIRVTMVCTIYGILIYLFSIILWFAANIIIEKKFK